MIANLINILEWRNGTTAQRRKGIKAKRQSTFAKAMEDKERQKTKVKRQK
jgi:hypothetical protein